MARTPRHSHSLLRDDLQIHRPDNAPRRRTLNEPQAVAQTTIRDRIFIAKEVKELGVYETWVKAVRTFEKDKVYTGFAEQYAILNAKIVEAATKGV